MPYKLTSGKYPYPLNFLASDGGTFDKPFIVNPNFEPPPAGEEAFYIVCCTPEQWNQIMSSMNVGAPIAYADTYNEPLQLMYQADQFPNSFEGSCVDLCDLILECINDTQSIQEAIARYGRGSSTSTTTTDNPDILNQNAFGDADLTGCDNDTIFGAATGLVDLLDSLSQDILNAIASAPNPIARVGDLIEAIPVVGEAPVDDLLQFTEAIANDFVQAYQTAFTTTFRDELRCELFCLANQTCDLQLSAVLNFYQSRITSAVTGTDMLTLISDIIAGNWLGQQTVYGMHWIIVKTIIFGGAVIDVDSGRLVTMVSALFNDPDSDWATLCQSCLQDEFEHTVTFDGLDACTNIVLGVQAGNGVRSINSPNPLPGGTGNQDNCYVTVDIPDSTVLTGGTLVWDRVTSPSTTGTNALIRQNDLQPPSYASAGQTFATGTDLTLELPAGTYSNFGILVRGGMTGTNNALVKTITLRGLKSENGGINPFAGGTC